MRRLAPRAPKGVWTVLMCAAFAVANLAMAATDAGAPGIREAHAKPDKKKRRRNLNLCIDFDHEVKGRTMEMRLTNGCGSALHCTVRWDLVCQDSGERTHHAETFEVAADATHEVSASAATCGDGGWAVERGRWDCHD